MEHSVDETGIAVIGLAGRFPGARDVTTFWRNLCAGVESIHFLSDQELAALGGAPAAIGDARFVQARAMLDDIELFDASFFGFSPREAEIMDPQHRILLECAWEALESAGYDPDRYPGAIGVYAGATVSTYLLYNLAADRALLNSLTPLQIHLGNAPDFLTTRVSYKLNLTGPSYLVECACSTSLVAVHVACQSLLNEECDIALAGGISINVRQRAGYHALDGGMDSPDGHCRAFDAQAQGTIFGSGAGLVVLKRLPEALADGDYLYAVIKGSAVNNDGTLKVGYTAPSVAGQARVIAEALADAGVSAETITYVETHGTGTAQGDPIEVQALTRAFRADTDRSGFCALGSVKTNIGHLEAAAGAASLIKTVLALKHNVLPPSLHFERPNPEIDFEHTPFYVNTRTTDWQAPPGLPRRAGVSSFGFGGTNAHVVVEAAPEALPTSPARPWQLLVFSAKTASALETATANLKEHVQQHAQLDLADVAYTLQLGRQAFSHRRIAVCRDREDAVRALELRDPQRVLSAVQTTAQRPVAFMFTGQGAQYAGMAAGLYQHEPVFREAVDHCAELLMPHMGLDLRDLLYPDLKIEDRRWRIEDAESSILYPLSSILDLDQTQYAQPALFVVEYALARLWMEWGVQPQAMIGHSLGEYVAACLAGVFALEDALELVALRGRLMQSLPAGAMLAVFLPMDQVMARLDQSLSLAAVNGPALCAVSGSAEAIAALEHQLTAEGVACRRLHTTHAFHSAMMDPIVESFAARLRSVQLRPPRIATISSLTGTWVTAQDATDPTYWAQQLRQTVRFAQGLETLLQDHQLALLEVGPGQVLCRLARPYLEDRAEPVALPSIRPQHDPQPDRAFLLTTLGRLWLAGVAIDWPGFYRRERRRRLPLPTYPFERQRYWIEPDYPIEPAPARPGEALDRELPEPSGRPAPSLRPRPDLPAAYYAPDTELEQQLAQLWQNALGTGPIGIDDNFFDLGGDSLLAMHVIAQLKKELRIDLPAAILYEAVTIRALGRLLGPAESAATAPETMQRDAESKLERRRSYRDQQRSRRKERDSVPPDVRNMASEESGPCQSG